MFKQLTPLIACVVLSGPFAAPAMAQGGQAPPNTSANLAFCRDFIQEVPGVTLGGCVSFLGTQDLGSPGFITHLCQAFEGSDPENFYQLYDSLADCIASNHRS